MSTYNPQERTFIKRPEPKTCPSCGQFLPTDVKPITNHMNHYVAVAEGAKAAVYNSNEETLNIDGVTLYRVDSPAHKLAIANKPKQTTAPLTPSK